MLPFRVDRIEQPRALQQNAAKLSLPHLPLAAKLPSERKLTKSNRQIPDPLSDRLSRRDFASASAQNMACFTQKNETVLAKWAPTSNRQWLTNRSYTKQTTKPRLTGTRTHIRLSLNSTKIAQNLATFESQNTELPPWNSLWRTGLFLPSDRPLLPGSDQNIENDVTHRKQSTRKFLPGATTTHSHSPKFRKVAQGSDELYN
jgi:hypothetical protein